MDIQKEIIFPQIKKLCIEVEEKLRQFEEMGIDLNDLIIYWHESEMEYNVMKFRVSFEFKRKNGL